MRTFHIGGIAMRGAEKSKLEAKNDGIVKFNNLIPVINKEGVIVVVNRNANIAVLDHRGREIEHYQVPYGAKVLVKDGGEVKARQEFAEWDPFSSFILTEDSGAVKFHDVVLGLTMDHSGDHRSKR
jgi:DNA-directed RNA polymerase subunit beta'